MEEDNQRTSIKVGTDDSPNERRWRVEQAGPDLSSHSGAVPIRACGVHQQFGCFFMRAKGEREDERDSDGKIPWVDRIEAISRRECGGCNPLQPAAVGTAFVPLRRWTYAGLTCRRLGGALPGTQPSLTTGILPIIEDEDEFHWYCDTIVLSGNNPNQVVAT
ncbi:hypothetical protein CFAM422_000503 [Trichoderma lentiforme]|uniref:Uncharacterized protein n=1 Tax=Trichoderma lentiforme TaxID=1567552 RepID=A0A9P4XRG8_9HYPO|nr:hypothetical protein CFAM422_000503 [Trichoderma lentiforme]